MVETTLPPEMSSDSHFEDSLNGQLLKVFKAFFETPRTMKEADFACGIMRESICRYVRTLRLAKKIVLLRKRYCKVTRHWAGEYTTNPELFPKPSQLDLFGESLDGKDGAQ